MHSINHTYQTISLFLAFLMFLTSTGLSIDMHFCGNHLKSFSLTGKAKNCFELAKSSTCPKHKKEVATANVECEMSKKDCCHNKTLNLQADLTPDLPANDFLISPQLDRFIIAYVAVFIDNKPETVAKPSFAHYKPPLIPRDIPVLVQSFLI